MTRQCWHCGERVEPIEKQGWLCCSECGEHPEYLDH